MNHDRSESRGRKREYVGWDLRGFRGLEVRRDGACGVDDADDGADEEEYGLLGERIGCGSSEGIGGLTTTREKTSILRL